MTVPTVPKSPDLDWLERRRSRMIQLPQTVDVNEFLHESAYLLAFVRELLRQRETVLELHAAGQEGECRAGCYGDTSTNADYPCPTVRALGEVSAGEGKPNV